MNKTLITGRITADLVLRYTQSEVPVLNFTLAVNRKFKNQDGEYETDFINCVAFRKTAQVMAEYLLKGDLVGIEGRIQTRNYENADGQKVYVTEVVVDEFDFLQPKKKEEVSNEEPIEKEEEEKDVWSLGSKNIVIDESELPF